jgi:hypothetical protein
MVAYVYFPLDDLEALGTASRRASKCDPKSRITEVCLPGEKKYFRVFHSHSQALGEIIQ